MILNRKIVKILQENTKKSRPSNKNDLANIFPHTTRRDKNNILLYVPLIARLSLNPDIALPPSPRALM